MPSFYIQTPPLNFHNQIFPFKTYFSILINTIYFTLFFLTTNPSLNQFNLTLNLLKFSARFSLLSL